MTRGIRYILVGFCDYGNEETWMEQYDPTFDGFAAAAGVKTGDIIRAIEVCSPETSDEETFSSRLVPVNQYTSDAQWKEMVRSCENIAGKTSVEFILERIDSKYLRGNREIITCLHIIYQ